MIRSPARTKTTGRIVRRLAIVGVLDVHAAEALELEIRRLAKRYRVEITWRRAAARDKRRASSI
jgi:hypothetical protein